MDNSENFRQNCKHAFDRLLSGAIDENHGFTHFDPNSLEYSAAYFANGVRCDITVYRNPHTGIFFLKAKTENFDKTETSPNWEDLLQKLFPAMHEVTSKEILQTHLRPYGGVAALTEPDRGYYIPGRGYVGNINPRPIDPFDGKSHPRRK